MSAFPLDPDYDLDALPPVPDCRCGFDLSPIYGPLTADASQPKQTTQPQPVSGDAGIQQESQS